MLEIGISVFVLLAAGYWATLWTMGRRDDVLHGQFVEFDRGDELTSATPAASPVPTRPKAAPARKPPVATAPAPDGEALQSLLASIKQELKNAAQI